MDRQWFTSAQWSHALTLAERNRLLADDLAAWQPTDEDLARGQRHLDAWRAQLPFGDDEHFAQRLAMDGIEPERLLTLLAAPLTLLRKRMPKPPAWLAQLAEAYTQAARAWDEWAAEEPAEDDLIGDDEAPDESASDESAPDAELFGFLEFVRPLVDQACDRLQEGIDDLVAKGGDLPFDPETVEDVLIMNLPDPLLLRISRTLVLELHVARLQGVLAGDTPEERFESFVERLSQPAHSLAILTEYPVLARQLMICLDQWVTVSLEFLQRLCADWALIRSRFCPHDDPGVLVEFTGGAGDTHRSGRSVMIAEFDSGFQLVYKPKSLAVDVHFQELLAWLNARGCQPPLYTLAILDRGAYGWVEFVARQDCRSIEEVERFYQRHGAYLALLYALNANDFHHENLIAAGEHPVLIDLETLIQPLFDRMDDTRADSVAERAVIDSVMQVSLLPLRMWSSEDYVGVDISGLGDVAGQLSPDRLPLPTAVGTDAMRYVRERIELEGNAHRPALNGVEVRAADYVDQVAAGFAHVYRLLMAHRDELLEPGGMLSRFAHDEIRVLLRQTRTYDQLLFESFHPDMLRDGLARERFLDRLWVAVPVRPYLAHVINAERSDLLQGDIPLFTTRPTSLALFGSDEKAIEGVLYETGMAVVQRRLQQMDEADLQRQTWFIKASFAALYAENEPVAVPVGQPFDAVAPVARAQLLDTVRTIADRLVETAIHGEDDASWIGLDLLDNQTWNISPLGIDLYGGVPGVALFLGYAGALLDDAQYTALARQALNTLVWQTENLRDELLKIGGLYGWGGVLYTLTHLAALWDDQSVLAHAQEVVEIIAAHVGADDEFDVARGSAGAILALLGLHAQTLDERGLHVALACGDHLLANAQTLDQGLGWEIPPYGASLLLGHAHGPAGIARALLELAAASGQERYGLAARQAMVRARSLYPSIDEQQPSLVGLALASSTPTSAVQLGLAHLCLHTHLGDPGLYDELRGALHAAQQDAGRLSHSLDGGDMGRLDLLLAAGSRLGDAALAAQVDRLAGSVLGDIVQGGWRCGVPSAVEVPSLMVGLAGIGYQMLRLAEPARVPSVLLLEPPVKPTGAGSAQA